MIESQADKAPLYRILRFEAQRRLGHIGHIGSIDLAARESKLKPRTLISRVSQFEHLIMEANTLMFEPDKKMVWGYHKDLIDLKNRLGEQRLHTLDELVEIYKSGLVDPDVRGINDTIDRTYEVIGKLFSSELWPFVYQLGSMEKLISGLLFEGYGVFVEQYLGVQGIAITTVRALEEVGFTVLGPQASLMRNVLPWMVEEMDQFPPLLARRLRRFK